MFLHCAQNLSTVAEQEFLRYKKVTADGREYQRDETRDLVQRRQAMKAWPPLAGAAPQGRKGRPAGDPTVARRQAATGMRTRIVHELRR
ncbi:hypothetical protein ABT288_15680 [Streptomyces sp. NPDC001093]|uniref:hypothetical protein n=1 Tax=Streptomyces sp. NPDC001093 TaxID=3154376 RepID=UPI00331DA7AA